MIARVISHRGGCCGFVGMDHIPSLKAELGVPDAFMPIGVMLVGRPLPDVPSPSLKRGWMLFEEYARRECGAGRSIRAAITSVTRYGIGTAA